MELNNAGDAHKLIVEKLLKCGSEQELLSIIFEDGQLINRPLLSYIIDQARLIKSEQDAASLYRLYDRLSFYFGQKIFSELYNKNAHELADYIEAYKEEIFTHLNYKLINFQIEQNEQLRTYSLTLKSILCRASVAAYLNEHKWPGLRNILIRSSDWLTDATSIEQFNTFMDEAPASQEYIKGRIDFVNNYRLNSEEVIRQNDLQWYMQQANSMSGTDQIAYLEQAISLAKEHQPQTHVYLLTRLGEAYYQLKGVNRRANIEKAIAAFEEALAVRIEAQRPKDRSDLLNILARTYLNRIEGGKAENVELAIQYFKDALILSADSGETTDHARILHNTGNAYIQRIRGTKSDNIETAIDYYIKALTIRKEAEHPQQWANTQSSLGTAYADRIIGNRADNIEKSIAAYLLALNVYTKEEYPTEWARNQNNLGTVYEERIIGEPSHNVKLAIDAFRQSLEIRTREKMPYEWANSMLNTGAAYASLSRMGEAGSMEYAIEFYEQALMVITIENDPKAWADLHNNLGGVYSGSRRADRGSDIETAIAAYNKSLLVFNKTNFPEFWARSQVNLGSAYSERMIGDEKENLLTAIKFMEQALTIYTQTDYPVEWVNTYKRVGTRYLKLHSWQEARNIFEKARDGAEMLRTETLSAEAKSKMSTAYEIIYASLITCCLELNDIAAAAGYAMESKSRTLIEQMGNERIAVNDLLRSDPALEAAYSPIKQKQAELQKLENELSGSGHSQILLSRYSELEAEINRLTNDFIYQHPEILPTKQVARLTAGDAQVLSNNLGGVPLIEYAIHTNGWGAFIIRPSGVVYVPLSSTLHDDIEHHLLAILADTFWDNEQEALEALKELHRRIFAPLQRFLPEKGPLLIAPARLLHLIPFQALITPGGAYLSDSYALSLTPCIAASNILYSQYTKRERVATPESKVLIVAHPGSGKRFLPNVKSEMKAVRKCFKNGEVLYDNEAIPDKVIEMVNSGSYDTIHFSCHGSFNYSRPELSGLSLANGSNLWVHDIFINMRLKGYPMVALSACQTGQIKPAHADESIGLSWSFIIVGASVVISSLWSVNDTSTQELFSYFYKIRSTKRVSDAVALQLAIGKMRSKWAYRKRPRYWAAFQAMGLPLVYQS